MTQTKWPPANPGRFSGWLVILIDQAHELPKAAFEILHDRMERHPGRVTFLTCTTEINGIPERTRALFQAFEVGPLGVPQRIELLRRITRDEGYAADDLALEVLARRGGGRARDLIRDLEELVDGDAAITLERVREYFGRGAEGAVAEYARLLLERQSLERQLSALDAWDGPADEKAREIRRFFDSVFSADILKLGGRSSGFDLGAVAERSLLVDALLDRATELKMKPAAFFSDVARFWAEDKGVDELALIRKVNEFDERLNGPGGSVARTAEGAASAAVVPRRRVFAGGIAGAGARADEKGKRSSGHGAKGRLEFLNFKQAKDVWDAGSFLIQKFGLYLNARITIRWERLGIEKAEEIGPFLTELLHEMRMVVERRCATDDMPEPFHWIYVHESDRRGEKLTNAAACIPDYADDVRAWIIENFLPNRFGKRDYRSGVVFRHGRRPVGEEGKLARHLGLMRLLCRGLDPELMVEVIGPRGLGVQERRLKDVLRIRGSTEIGRRFGAQRFSASRLIGPGARREAEKILPPISIFKERAWRHWDQEWEQAEYIYRMKLEEEWAAAEAKVHGDWPDKDELSSRGVGRSLRSSRGFGRRT